MEQSNDTPKSKDTPSYELNVDKVILFVNQYNNIDYGFGCLGLGVYIFSSAFRPELLIFIPDGTK